MIGTSLPMVGTALPEAGNGLPMLGKSVSERRKAPLKLGKVLPDVRTALRKAVTNLP